MDFDYYVRVYTYPQTNYSVKAFFVFYDVLVAKILSQCSLALVKHTCLLDRRHMKNPSAKEKWYISRLPTQAMGCMLPDLQKKKNKDATNPLPNYFVDSDNKGIIVMIVDTW